MANILVIPFDSATAGMMVETFSDITKFNYYPSSKPTVFKNLRSNAAEGRGHNLTLVPSFSDIPQLLKKGLFDLCVCDNGDATTLATHFRTFPSQALPAIFIANEDFQIFFRKDINKIFDNTGVLGHIIPNTQHDQDMWCSLFAVLDRMEKKNNSSATPFTPEKFRAAYHEVYPEPRQPDNKNSNINQSVGKKTVGLRLVS